MQTTSLNNPDSKPKTLSDRIEKHGLKINKSKDNYKKHKIKYFRLKIEIKINLKKIKHILTQS